MKKFRIATLQYFIRPVTSFEQFEEQVSGLIETAADYKCRMIVFPEYFTIQLLTLGDVKRPILQQVRDLANQEERFCAMMAKYSKQHNIYIVGGSIPGHSTEEPGKIFNRCHVFSPNGNTGFQAKLHMTRFENEEWKVSPGTQLKIFKTEFGSFSVNICYDVEFPEIARVVAKQGVNMIIVPSCTDDRNGFLRVRYCAHARAIENQLYVVHAGTVGSLPQVPAVSLNYGQASILTPCDFPFARDGILAEGIPNQETMVIGELHFDTVEDSRKTGTVLPLRDSHNTATLIQDMQIVVLSS